MREDDILTLRPGLLTAEDVFGAAITAGAPPDVVRLMPSRGDSEISLDRDDTGPERGESA